MNIVANIAILVCIIVVFILMLKLRAPEPNRGTISASQPDQFIDPTEIRHENSRYRPVRVGVDDDMSHDLIYEQLLSKHTNLDTTSLQRKIYMNGKLSNVEAICRRVVTSLVNKHGKYDPVYNVRFAFNVNPMTGHALEYDIFIPELNFAVEYNGGFHSKPDAQYRDRVKLNHAADKGIFLITVPKAYTTDTAMRNYIKEELLKNPSSLATKEYLSL